MRNLLTACLGLAIVVTAGADDRASMAPISAENWNTATAAHLLRRAGFGGTPAEVDRLAALSPEEAVDFLVDYDDVPYAIAPPAISTELYEPEDRAARRSMSEEERRRFRDQRRKLERSAFEETRLW
ncbi:MAG: hypothetical protein KDA32_12185, partial [Phycisphaerales bacterium]|nr:hypothetical protein [Phycisphaerales bacterium]